jgi:hypothetical protein
MAFLPTEHKEAERGGMGKSAEGGVVPHSVQRKSLEVGSKREMPRVNAGGKCGKMGMRDEHVIEGMQTRDCLAMRGMIGRRQKENVLSR